MNNQQWLIIGEITNGDILMPIFSMASALSTVIVLVLLIGFFIMIWISNHIEHPIRKVLEGTRMVGKGHFDFQLETSTFKSQSSELRELGSNFNSMTGLIQKYIMNLRNSEERYRLILEYSSDMITVHDPSGKYLYVSKSAKEILQYEEDEMHGQDIYHFIHPDDVEYIKNNHDILLTTGFVVSTYRMRRKDGEYIWFESSIRVLQDQQNEVDQLIVVSRNISERKKVEQQLRDANKVLQQLSTKDSLTNVGNRRYFDEKLHDEWHRSLRNGAPLTLIMLDIDYFKAYNDHSGHPGGDECLRKVAAAIQKTTLRSGDVVCRYGGEEFVVILPNTDERGASLVAENIRNTVEALRIPHKQSEISDIVTVSLGTTTVVPNRNMEMNHLFN
ncbi:diguanylate cyclase domain-containing protein [Alkalihalobacterium alkalinitrilicum]|uniref:diguanylate cyclase domain-containing protein n=1 Tax=Alkalihalobacterium alkalinitrilicum TaxID=427920 RepID=UPI000995BB62|nr:diguanylate cyclase [Alkalihalobacterium alkalinitrilicum]